MTSIANIQEIKSLISLLDDNDPEVISTVSDEIVRRGSTVTPWLKETLASSRNEMVQARINDLLHRIHLAQITERLEKWVVMGQENLLLGVLTIIRYQYPELREEAIIRRLGHITQDIYLRIKDDMSPIDKVRVVNNVLYDDYEFYGNKRDFLSPPCYYLNMVFDTGKGNHLSLGIIYILVARSLGIPVAGIDLPGYFFLAYRENDQNLFYINPFSKGNTLTHNELVFFLKMADIDISHQSIVPADNMTIMIRLVQGLIEAYKSLDKDQKVTDLQGLLNVLEP
jgi:hypothetical protein